MKSKDEAISETIKKLQQLAGAEGVGLFDISVTVGSYSADHRTEISTTVNAMMVDDKGDWYAEQINKSVHTFNHDTQKRTDTFESLELNERFS